MERFSALMHFETETAGTETGRVAQDLKHCLAVFKDAGAVRCRFKVSSDLADMHIIIGFGASASLS